jgi:hypothetical protein
MERMDLKAYKGIGVIMAVDGGGQNRFLRPWR